MPAQMIGCNAHIERQHNRAAPCSSSCPERPQQSVQNGHCSKERRRTAVQPSTPGKRSAGMRTRAALRSGEQQRAHSRARTSADRRTVTALNDCLQ